MRTAWTAPSAGAVRGSAAMARLGRAADLLLPGAVSVVLVTPALSLGALAALMRADFSLGAGELGAMFALYFLCSAVSASAGGRFAARWSATRLVRAAVVCAALVCAVIALVPSKPVLIGGCVVAGAANGLAAPALNMLILWLIPSNRHGLAFGVRVAAAPGTSTLAALGAYAVASAGWHWPAFYWGAVTTSLARLRVWPYSSRHGWVCWCPLRTPPWTRRQVSGPGCLPKLSIRFPPSIECLGRA